MKTMCTSCMGLHVAVCILISASSLFIADAAVLRATASSSRSEKLFIFQPASNAKTRKDNTTQTKNATATDSEEKAQKTNDTAADSEEQAQNKNVTTAEPDEASRKKNVSEADSENQAEPVNDTKVAPTPSKPAADVKAPAPAQAKPTKTAKAPAPTVAPVVATTAAPPPVPAALPAVPCAPTIVAVPPAPAVMPTAKPQFTKSVCAAASGSCSRCTALAECGWCPMEQKCVDGTKLGPRNEQCLAYEFTRCTTLACEQRNSCTDCTADRGCGWCASKATCTQGDAAGPFTASTCPAAAGFVGSRPVWAHSFGTTKCLDTPPLHSSSLWSNLRDLMYKSQARVQRMQASAVAPAPAEPCQTVPRPQQPGAPAASPYQMETIWVLPSAPAAAPPASTEIPQTTKQVTTAPCPKQRLPLATPAPVVQQPPIEVNVDVNQIVKNKANAGRMVRPEGDKRRLIPTTPVASPAAVIAGSPSSLSYAPAPAQQNLEYPEPGKPAKP